MIPIFPFLNFFLIKAIFDYKNEFRKKLWVSLLLFFQIITFIFIVAHKPNLNLNKKTLSLSQQEKELYKFIKQNTKKTDTIVFIKPRVLQLYTDRIALEVNEKNLKKYQYYLLIGNIESNYFQSRFVSYSKYNDNNPFVALYAHKNFTESNVKKTILFENDRFQFIKINKEK